MLTLEGILDLVGVLDDAPGQDTPRERFRRFLHESVETTGAVRDYIEASVRNKGLQHNHALQDLINHAASLIGFEVEFGRYRGVANDIGHDGLWRRGDYSIVVEVKTTDAYAIKTATLVGYIDRLISEERIADWDHAMGLYVIARTDSDLLQLANSITAEKRTQQLRIATVDSVLSIAELVQANLITADEAVALLKPASVFVSDAVGLLARVASGPAFGLDSPDDFDGVDAVLAEGETTTIVEPETIVHPSKRPPATTKRLYAITPVRDEPDMPAQDAIQGLLQAGWYVFGDSTPLRRQLKPGDRICFYQSGVGVVAEAEVASQPERRPPDTPGLVRDPEGFPWSFRVRNQRFLFDQPIVIDATLRANLDSFAGKDPNSPWGWFVQTTRTLTEHDFRVLTNQPVVAHDATLRNRP